ncbi:secreted protein, partial [gut metagenome]
MKRSLAQIGVAVLALCAGMACSDGKKKQAFTQAKSQAQTKQIIVDTLVMKRCSFHKQIVCNGKLHA